MGEKPTRAEEEEPGVPGEIKTSNLNLSKSNINREAAPGGGAAGEPASIAVSDPGAPGPKREAAPGGGEGAGIAVSDPGVPNTKSAGGECCNKPYTRGCCIQGIPPD